MAIHAAVCAAAFCLLIFIRAPLLACSCDVTRENIAALASSDALNMIYHLTLRQHAYIRSLPFFLPFISRFSAWLIYSAFLGFDKRWKLILFARLSQLSHPSIATQSIIHGEKPQRVWVPVSKGLTMGRFVDLSIWESVCVCESLNTCFLVDHSDFLTSRFLRPCGTPGDRLVVKVTLP